MERSQAVLQPLLLTKKWDYTKSLKIDFRLKSEAVEFSVSTPEAHRIPGLLRALARCQKLLQE